MKHVPTRLTHRLAAGAATAIALGALAACGGSEETQKLNFKVNGVSSGTAIAVPKSAEAGPTVIRYSNNSTGRADLQLIRVEGDRDAKEVSDALSQATEGKPYPKWFLVAGGVGLIEPAEVVTVEQVLQPGTYYAFDTEGGLNPKSARTFKVTGEPSEEELGEGEATVRAIDYGFKSTEPLVAGTHQIRFDNVGSQPHHMLAAKLTGKATAEQAEKAFKRENGPKPPLDVESLQTTAVLEGGESQLVTFELEPGRYAFFCFITDRQGGPPHVKKGMVDEFEVVKAKE